MSHLRLGLYFALSLGGFGVVQHYFHQHFQRVLLLLFGKESLALAVYALLLLPGVALHEVSHWVSARVLGVRTSGFSLWPRRVGGHYLRLGYVEVHKVDAMRSALIGVAPLVMGTLFLAVLRVVVPEMAVDILNLGARVREGGGGYIRDLLSTPHLWLYLALTVSNTMLPSRADMSAWAIVLGGLVLVVGGVVLLGHGETLLEAVVVPLESGLQWLAGLFAVVLVLDGLLVVPILISEWLLSRLTGVEFV